MLARKSCATRLAKRQTLTYLLQVLRYTLSCVRSQVFELQQMVLQCSRKRYVFAYSQPSRASTPQGGSASSPVGSWRHGFGML